MNILITGGASGLGAAITKKLASSPNNKIYFTYSNSSSKAKTIESNLKNTVAIKCNFESQEEIASLLEKMTSFDLDVLINNAYAGDITPTHYHKIITEKFLTDFSNNIMPTVSISQEAIKIFRKKKNGNIITILTSYLSEKPPMGLSTYIANKAYLKKLTEIWAVENAKFNIMSNAVSPAFMQTGLTSDVDERIIEQMIDNHPAKRLLTVEEVAESVSRLTTVTSETNGTDLIINAGDRLK
jgi:NAD(P)-dependent dehydrogenase (short-subunit alcohol dehydrogenase family)